jgi:hypothetical protein
VVFQSGHGGAPKRMVADAVVAAEKPSALEELGETTAFQLCFIYL